MTNLPSRLLIVDDSIPVRRAIVSLIAQNSPEWLVCGEAADAEEGARLCRSLAPDVVLIDLSLSGGDGLSLARTLTELSPKTRIVLMSAQERGTLSLLATEYSFDAIPKSSLANELPALLRRFRTVDGTASAL
jgi:DNA-binding NarL/FixJ family response regulator